MARTAEDWGIEKTLRPLSIDEAAAAFEHVASADDTPLLLGLGRPHSYRGHYACLALEPVPRVRPSLVAAALRSADGIVFVGWKGGEYLMDSETPVFWAKEGCCGVPLTYEVIQLLAAVRSPGRAHG